MLSAKEEGTTSKKPQNIDKHRDIAKKKNSSANTVMSWPSSFLGEKAKFVLLF